MPKISDLNGKRIIISRTDSIGDVVLTLPLAGIIKKKFPGCEIIFLGKGYTRDIISLSENINEFADWDTFHGMEPDAAIRKLRDLHSDIILHVFPRSAIARLAKMAGIPVRVGSTGRLYHYFNCNVLVPLSRRRSPLHEAQLNTLLLKPLGFDGVPGPEELSGFYGINDIPVIMQDTEKIIDKTRFNLILHPKSKGSAREWGLENFRKLAGLLDPLKFKIFVTGLDSEKEILQKEGFFEDLPAIDMTGKFDLSELIGFISHCDGLVAASTGPLHIAAATGKHAIGIFPPIKPMHAGRWGPVGKQCVSFSLDKKCSKCRKSDFCECMQAVKPEDVAAYLNETAER